MLISLFICILYLSDYWNKYVCMYHAVVQRDEPFMGVDVYVNWLRFDADVVVLGVDVGWC